MPTRIEKERERERGRERKREKSEEGIEKESLQVKARGRLAANNDTTNTRVLIVRLSFSRGTRYLCHSRYSLATEKRARRGKGPHSENMSATMRLL